MSDDTTDSASAADGTAPDSTAVTVGTGGLVVERIGRVVHARIDNPRRRNALTDSAMRGLIDLVEQVQTDESVGALLLSGVGDDFCSGFDIVGRNRATDGERPRVGSVQRRLPTQAHRLVPELLALQVPVVSAVHGYAVGLGMQLALASDVVVADGTARFWQPFITRGMTPDSGATWLTVRAVGPARARRLLLLGERLDAATARDWGVVTETVDDGRALDRGRELAETLAAGPTVALGLTKSMINAAADSSLSEQLRHEAFALELASRSPDFREGLTAFTERREPRFTGR